MRIREGNVKEVRCLQKILLVVLAVSGLCFGASRSVAEERLALVLGNSDYGSVSSLDNPVQDAALIAAALETMGFQVTLLANTSQLDMKRSIAQFGRDLRRAGPEATGLFYYAGHGVQSFGNNYLLPVDVDLSDAADLDLMAVEAQSVLRQMGSARNRTNIVILDACRNNPFQQIPELNDNGLAEMQAPTGTFLAYATAPGGVALDGQDGNSPFTQALVEQIQIPGRPIEQAFKQVRVAVLEQTGGNQTPWDTSSLTSDFIFVAAPEKPVLTTAEAEELQVWRSVKTTGDPVQLMLFLRGYPNSRYVPEARELLSVLMENELSGSDGAGQEPSVAEVMDAPLAPSAAEQAMFEAALAKQNKADFQAFIDAYPVGVYTEMAQAELAALVADQATDPQPEAEEQVVVAEPTAPVVRQPEPGPITYASPLDVSLDMLNGRSLSDVTQLSPMFPPIEGLPESYWKDQTCSNCHQWTQDTLCTQANVYLGLNMQRSLEKQHPFGGALKRALKSWAAGGCQ